MPSFAPCREVCGLGVGWGPGTSRSSFPYPDETEPLLPWCLQMAVSGPSAGLVVAPVSGNSLGARRAEIKPGVREIHLCKDERGKTGLRFRAIDQVGLGTGGRGGVPGGRARLLDAPLYPRSPSCPRSPMRHGTSATSATSPRAGSAGARPQ